MCLICDCEFGTKSEAVSHVKENHLDVISQSETPLTHQEDFNSTLESRNLELPETAASNLSIEETRKISQSSYQILPEPVPVHEPVHKEKYCPIPAPRKMKVLEPEAIQNHIKTVHDGKKQLGLNYKTLQIGKALVFHANDGYKYLRTRVNSTGTTVYLR